MKPKAQTKTPSAGPKATRTGKATKPAGTVAETPASTPPTTAKTPSGKIGMLVALLMQPDGADLETMMNATGWQGHSVRGAIAGSIKKKLGHKVTSQKTGIVRIWRIVEVAA